MGTQEEIIAIDTETEGLDYKDKPFCVSYYSGSTPVAISIQKNEEYDALHGYLKTFQTWVFHNAKFDLQKLEMIGIIPSKDTHIHDTYIMAHLINENRNNGLKNLAKSILGIEDLIEVEIKSGKNKGQKKYVPKEQYDLNQARKDLKLKKEDGYHKLPWDVIAPYAKKDAQYTYDLYFPLKKELIKQNLSEVYQEELELIPVLMDMERNGIRIDTMKLDAYIKDFYQQLYEAELACKVFVDDTNFNPSSPKQVKEKFHELGVDLEGTGKDILQNIDQPLARLILDYRKIDKILSTYLEGIKEEIILEILHPQFKSMVRTGRMASGKHRGD